MIQRNYEVGFNRAGRIMMQLERAGIVGRQQGAKPRDILFHDLPSLEAAAGAGCRRRKPGRGCCRNGWTDENPAVRMEREGGWLLRKRSGEFSRNRKIEKSE